MPSFCCRGPASVALLAASSLRALDGVGLAALDCPWWLRCGDPRTSKGSGFWPSWMFSPVVLRKLAVFHHVHCCSFSCLFCCVGAVLAVLSMCKPWQPGLVDVVQPAMGLLMAFSTYVVLAAWSWVQCLRFLGCSMRRRSVVLDFYLPFPLCWACSSCLPGG